MSSSEWSRWFRETFQLFQGGSGRKMRTCRRPPRVRPQVEALEDRLAPSTVQFSAAAETINELAGAFSISVTLSGTVTPTVSTFASGFSLPFGEAFDATGNLYVANVIGGTVSRVTPTGVVSTFASGFSLPIGLAFDAAGNLYVSNIGTNSVSKVTPAGVVSAFASGFSSPEGLAFDAAGNLYVANTNAGTVCKVTPSGVVSTFASGFSIPTGLAFDATGNLYVSNANAGTVSKVTSSGVVSTFASGFGNPAGLAFDTTGNLYVANRSNNTVSRVTPAGLVSTFASGFSSPVGLAFDAAGNLFVANFNNTVSEVSMSVSVPFTLGGTATLGTDYSNVTAGPLVIPFGQTTGTITGTLLDDPGPSQTLTFTLGTPTGADLGSPSVNTLTIDEQIPNATITINPYSGVYDGQAHGLTGTATGSHGEDLSSLLSLGSTFTNAGHYIVTWTFAGNANYAASSGTSTVDITPATLTVTANALTKVYGSADPALTFTVSGLQSTDTASTVLSGALTRAAGETVAGGPYAISQGTLAANGNYTINFIGSRLTINPDATTTVVSSSANPSDYGQAVTFSVTVTANPPGSGTPTGTVTFLDGGTVLGTVAVDATGHASFTTAPFALAVGNHAITAVYSGDGNFTASSSSLTEAVLSAQQQIALLASQINALVNAGVLNGGNGTALKAKLNSATASLNAGNTTAGINQLNAFIDQVKALVNSGKLSSAVGQTLISAAQQAIVSAR